MSAYLPFGAQATGAFFGLIKRGSTGQVWNGTGFEAWLSAHYANYQVDALQDGVSAGWKSLLPAGLPSNETLYFVPVLNNGSESADAHGDPILFGVDLAGDVYLPVNTVTVDGFPADLVGSLDGLSVSIVSPVGRGNLSVAQGGAYRAQHNNALDFLKPAAASWPADLSLYTNFRLTLTKSADNANAVPIGGSNPLVISGNYLVATGTGQAVRFEMASTDTQQMAIGAGTRGYDLRITCVSGSDTIVLLEGQCTVTQ